MQRQPGPGMPPVILRHVRFCLHGLTLYEAAHLDFEMASPQTLAIQGELTRLLRARWLLAGVEPILVQPGEADPAEGHLR